MIEISNTFLLVWLVVLALICIYLLYMSLTRNNEADTLKSSITNLVRQNKKRDELINFLMERVETLTNAVNTLALPAQPEINSNNNNNLTEKYIYTEQLSNNIEPEKIINEINLDDVLNSISLPHKPNHDINHDHLNHDQLVQNTPSDVPKQLNMSEFPEEIGNSEFGDKLNTQTQQINLDDVLESMPTTFKDDDLISTILGADESASQLGDEDHTKEPPGKIRLLGMNVKQLKQIAKDMNIKSRGNKTDLVEGIWSKMNSNNGQEYIHQEQQQMQNELSISPQNETLPELLIDQKTAQTSENIQQENTIPQLLVEEFPDDI